VEAFLLLAGGVGQTTALLLSRDSIDSLISAQVFSMSILFGVVLASHFIIGGTNDERV